MPALFGDAVDQFFITFEEPPQEYEESVTEAIYSAALESRKSGGEPRDYVQYDYNEQEAEMSRPPDMIFTMGYTHGYERKFPQEPKNMRYMLEYSWGEERRRSEHRDTTILIFESSGMSSYARRGRVGS